MNISPSAVGLINDRVSLSAPVHPNYRMVSVGPLYTLDPDNNQHSYELVEGDGDTDNVRFEIVQNCCLMCKNPPASPGTCSIRIRTDDGESNPLEKSLAIQFV